MCGTKPWNTTCNNMAVEAPEADHQCCVFTSNFKLAATCGTAPMYVFIMVLSTKALISCI